MLEVNSTIGNIFDGKEFANLKKGNFEILLISRMDLEKRILRKKTNLGTDVGLKLEPGIKLHHGDVIKNGDKIIIIEQLPEKVISVKIKNRNTIDVVVLLGHIIGNRHRPISIHKEEILFPIQADSEKEVFIKLFQSIINHIEIRVDEQIFVSHSGANIHEH
ncbi:MAG: Urease accessory protein [Nitrosopumilus sp.]|nr:Urease accessory protein [Nitrosopumilus sp.]